MVSVEQELIGACLNTPSASLDALGVLPNYFSDAKYAAIWERMISAEGQFSVATIMADLPDCAEAAYEAFDSTYADFSTTKATAASLVEDYKRREGRRLLDWMHNQLSHGGKLSEVAAEYQTRIDDLARIGEAQSRFKPVPIGDIQIPLTPWIIKGVMPTSGVGFIAGAPGAAKTFLALHIALSLATGKQGVFKKRCKPIGVAYVAAEDFAGCQTRAKAWELRHKGQHAAAFEMIDGPVNLLDAGCISDLVHAINGSARNFEARGQKLGLVVFDTLARCVPGADENNAQDMSVAVQALQDVGKRTGAFVAAVAHHGKAGTTGGIRGWSGLNGASDMTITVERNEDDPDLRVATMSKVKNGIDGWQVAFRLDRVGLDIRDEDGDELDSCVCVFEALPEANRKSEKQMPSHTKLVFDALNWCIDNTTAVAPPHGAPQRAWSRAVAFGAVKDRSARTGFLVTSVAGFERFNRSLEWLVAEKRISMDTEEDLIWRI